MKTDETHNVYTQMYSNAYAHTYTLIYRMCGEQHSQSFIGPIIKHKQQIRRTQASTCDLSSHPFPRKRSEFDGKRAQATAAAAATTTSASTSTWDFENKCEWQKWTAHTKNNPKAIIDNYPYQWHWHTVPAYKTTNNHSFAHILDRFTNRFVHTNMLIAIQMLHSLCNGLVRVCACECVLRVYVCERMCIGVSEPTKVVFRLVIRKPSEWNLMLVFGC